MSSPPLWQALLAIGLLAVIAYGSRVLGLLVLSKVPLGPKVQRFVDAMSTSVLIAIVAPLIVYGDGGARLAALATTLVAILWRSPLLAIGLGMMAAAAWRWWLQAA